MGVEKLALKTKKLHPDESLPPTIELTVRYLLAKAAATTLRAGVSNESVQAAQPKPARIFSSLTASTHDTTHNLLSSDAPTTARPTNPSTIPRDDESSLRPSSQTTFQLSSTTYGGDNGDVANKKPNNVDIVDIEDFDEDEFDGHEPRTTRMNGGDDAVMTSARVSTSHGGVKLSTSDAASLKDLLFAKQGGRQPASWIQGFFFSQEHELEYGLVQREGGPCGILAAVQAHVLKQLVGKTGGHPTGIAREQQRNALCKGLSAAIWQVRGEKASVSVVKCSIDGGVGTSTAGMSFDELLRAARVESAESVEDVERLVADSLRQWEEPRGQGVCMFVLSLLISRGIAETRGDMDEAGSSLMGAYG